MSDRLAATAEAATLLSWDLEAPAAAELNALAETLVRFDSTSALATHLDSLGLLFSPDAPGGRSDPLTAADLLRARGNVLWFDVETGMFPNEHDALLDELAALAGSPLADAHFEEVPPSDWENEEELYRLRALLGEHSYDVAAQNYGDWYDLETVLALINTMAADAAAEVRFFSLPTGDQTAAVLVADEGPVLSLIDEGLLAVPMPNQSMNDGKTFEHAVRRHLQEQGTLLDSR